MTDVDDGKWRSELKAWVTWAASSADDLADAGIRRMRKRLGRAGVPKIQPYMGYATKDRIRVHGRVLTNPPLDPDFSKDDWLQNLIDTARRFASDEVPGVTVVANAQGTVGTSVSDVEGYFHIDLPRKSKRSEELLWSAAELRIQQGSADAEQSAAFGEVMYTPPHAAYGIISDVDDTILHTGATDVTTMAKLTLFGNARTRAPLDGVAELYRLMQHGGDLQQPHTNPIFYVSSSPWNLYDLLEDFLELNAIPKGPLLLRDLGFDANKFLKSGHDHKLDKVRNLMNLFDTLPFVLFGDSGQDDPRLYAMAAEEFGERIKMIFIRDIDPDVTSDHDAKVAAYVKRSEAAGVPLFLIRDSNQAAEIAVRHGLLPADVLNSIAEATRRDENRKRGIL
ncbi:phosphatase domain-containing protein [Planctomycetes bacterium K23_9]